MGETYRIGTRASDLALAQTRTIVAWLRAQAPHAAFEMVEITTHGDRFADTPIVEMGDVVERGIFNSALEQAVLAGEVDLATCSFKDVESELPGGIVAASVGPREDTRDVLLTRHHCGLDELPEGSVLATSSPRRMSQLRAARADFRFQALRGNIPTRVQRADAEFDGVIVAGAGLIRLGLTSHVSQWIGHETLLPAAAQGALACQYHADRKDVAALVTSIQHPETELCACAEKALMIRLSGGCYAPIGVLAKVEGNRLLLQARIASLDGTAIAAGQTAGDSSDVDQLVGELAAHLIGQGAREIVDETRHAMLPDS